MVENKKSDIIQNNENVKNVLQKQLKDGSSHYIDEPGVEIPKHPFTIEELDVSMYMVDSILESNGYKTPEEEEFISKVKLKLNRIIDNKSSKNYLYINFFDHCDRKFNYHPYNAVEYNGIYIDKRRRIISKFFYVPEIIDYQKKYPDLSKIEDQVVLHYKKDENSYSVNLWKDFDDLSKERYLNQQLIISRNRYLFNDDKSQFPWLVMHDEFFMRSLVTEFGYTEDKKLLKWVIENTDLPLFSKFAETKHLKELGKLLWTKDCNGEIRVHQNTLDLLKELSTPHDDLYIMYVAEYLSNYMASFAIKEENLTIEQKAKIAAYLLYWGEQYKYDKHYDFNQMFMTRFYYYHFEREAYEKEFKKNNYYGLPKFKEWYEAAKKEKDYFNGGEGMEDDPNPYDYRRIAEPIK
ncbi:hypothetical protein [Apibacter mensalis]|uniref:hypothetical protein n=1 Tax=Apibacter mensalis TaxID=1586267 RepID=UPI0026EB7448|nr:hypothetical protein [Apibacter mensalis]